MYGAACSACRSELITQGGTPQKDRGQARWKMTGRVSSDAERALALHQHTDHTENKMLASAMVKALGSDTAMAVTMKHVRSPETRATNQSDTLEQPRRSRPHMAAAFLVPREVDTNIILKPHRGQ